LLLFACTHDDGPCGTFGQLAHMDVFLYFHERLSCGLDEIEDRVSDALGERGEVTGSGAGVSGSNIDVEITDDDVAEDEARKIIREAVAELNLPASSVVAINGRKLPL